MDIFGDRWSLLVLRDLHLGRTRFTDFVASPEGIPTNILAERLQRLQRSRLVRSQIVRAGSSRVNYVLTDKGKSLGPVLATLRDWSLKWIKGTRVGLNTLPK